MFQEIPVILLKNVIILPNQEIKIEVNNIISKKTFNESSSNYKNEILVISPLDELEENPGVEDLPTIGVIAKIKNKIDNDGVITIKLRGIKRVAVNKYFLKKDILYSEAMHIDFPSLKEEEEVSIIKKLVSTLKTYINESHGVSNDILSYINKSNDLNKITDAIASFLSLPTSKLLDLMQEINPVNRAKNLIRDINMEIKSQEIDNEINDKINDEFANNQREYLLKEKLEFIKKELGTENWHEIEVNEFKKLLSKLKINKKTKDHFNHEINKYSLMSNVSPEISSLRNYLDWTLHLPWNKSSKEVSNFNEVKTKLNQTHYGLDKVKNRIVEYIAIKNLNKSILSPIICLIGPPGVGKTSIAMSIASSLNKEFYKISVGGLSDATELIGTRRTYLASSPGRIIQGLNKCGTNNPVILIDEVDKIIKDYKTDPASALLDILDPIQNKTFIDNYIEEPFDLSNVLFILTANNKYDIPEVLLDRVEIINVNSYTCFEKIDIAKNYILPRVLKENMVYDKKIKFTDELLKFIIDKYTEEAGVRELERVLSSLARRITINNVKILNEERIIKLLGNPLYNNEEIKELEPGVVNTLAYTPYGGKVSMVEVISIKGDGKIIFTGNIGRVLSESIDVCITHIRSKYKLSFHNLDFHIHFLEHATKKDGPSAGLSVAVAILSLMKNISISNDIAFSGEITLNGSILKVGGIKEKIIAAFNKGIKCIYIPYANKDDLDSIPDMIKNNIEIKLVSKFSEVYTNIFK